MVSSCSWHLVLGQAINSRIRIAERFILQIGCDYVLGTDIAIDLGTYAVKIYVEGKGMVVNEPSVVAVRADSDEVLAVGSDAFAMLGRTSDKIKVIHPLTMGVISNFEPCTLFGELLHSAVGRQQADAHARNAACGS